MLKRQQANICTQLIHFVVQQKLTQRREAAVLQKESKIKSKNPQAPGIISLQHSL